MGLVVGGGPAAAQERVLDLRLLEVSDDGERTYHNLVYSHDLTSRVSLEAFSLFLPQLDDYAELGAGLGFDVLRREHWTLTLIGYLATASDGEYLEPALLAVGGEGPVTWSIFLLRYVPLGSEGIEQWLVDPAEVQVRIGGPVALGLSAYLYRPAGGNWLTKVGPKLSVADRLGASELAVRHVNEGGWELQLRRIFVF
jgi:hypothetical protein